MAEKEREQERQEAIQRQNERDEKQRRQEAVERQAREDFANSLNDPD